MSRTLLIDADILAYRASSANQRSYDWGDGIKSVAADEEEARKSADEAVQQLVEKLEADAVIVCLSDDFNNFRADRIDPTYKSNRAKVDRPVHLYDIKDWLADTYDTERWTALEADDVMGILATDPTRSDERIIVSADKDLMQIPGKLYRPQDQRGSKPVIHEISEREADKFHLYQAIVGDMTDGYPGLPGAGPVAAQELLAGLGWESFKHVLKSGPRKGTEEVRWRRLEMAPWYAIVSAYAKAGLTHTHALIQARLARILRYEDWDGKSPKLWSPIR